VSDQTARERPLFAVDADVYRWEDVVAFARLRGEWSDLVEDVREGLAALRDLAGRGEQPGADEVEAAAREFRYARGLLAGDELDAWLERRGLSHSEWRSYLERVVARMRVPQPARIELEQDEIDACLWPEAVCSGCLDELAGTLAAASAVAPAGSALEDLDVALADFSRRAASEQLIAREVEMNRLEWLRLAYEAADFADEDAASEAALCVRSDRDPLDAVAARAGVPLENRLDWLDEIDPELASRFLAAKPGDLVGPLPAGERFRLALLCEKRPPTVADEAVRERAAAAVVKRVVERETNERVIWLERL
jgi:hypothetical protein